MSKNILREIREWVISILVAVIIAIVIKSFLIDVIQVSGTSMLPYLRNNDRLVIEKVSMYMDSYKRGEIVIFKPTTEAKDIYIKRVIGLPGDKIDIKEGYVFVNNIKINENYLPSGTFTDIGNIEYSSLVVPENCLFVLGDNRTVSEDSRFIGPVPVENIKGHAIFRVFPFNQLKKI